MAGQHGRFAVHRPDVHSPMLDVDEVDVRPARSEDGETIRALTVAADGRTLEWATHLDAQIARPDRHVVVAVADGDVVGYGRAVRFDPSAFDPDEFGVQGPWTAPAGWYLSGVFVLPPWRRRGIARALVVARLEWLSGRTDEVYSFTDVRNLASLAMHASLGFVEVTREFTYPGQRGGNVLLRLDLGA
jgi:GNAT superfamily N-acetyltransferase